jgi:hypothetical protein
VLFPAAPLPCLEFGHSPRLSIGGENQLWRNQLMGYAIKKKCQIKNVHFSVVHHPDNNDLSDTLKKYQELLLNKDIFSSYTLREFIIAAEKVNEKNLSTWITWYRNLYMI